MSSPQLLEHWEIAVVHLQNTEVTHDVIKLIYTYSYQLSL